MSGLPTSKGTSNAISSPASADGAALFDSAGFGRIIDRFGRAVVLANLSPSQASKAGLLTSGISGRTGNTSSSSVVLQSSLESKLRARLNGSDLCEVIWKPWTTPWGACLSKPRARVRTISEIDIGLWRTLNTREKGGGDYSDPAKAVAKMTSGHQVNLQDQVIAFYPTLTSNAKATESYNEVGNSAGQVAIRKIALGLYSTLRSTDGEKGGPNMSFGAGGLPLPSQISEIARSSNVLTENGAGSLHPEFGGWELGYPPEWLSCAPSETLSTSGRRRNSSELATRRLTHNKK